MEKTLMHTCCAPCSVSCIQQLRSEGIEPVAYWYNPNIHPYQEYKARRDTLMAYAPTIGMELIVQENYGLREFSCTISSMPMVRPAGVLPGGLWGYRPPLWRVLCPAAGPSGPICRPARL